MEEQQIEAPKNKSSKTHTIIFALLFFVALCLLFVIWIKLNRTQNDLIDARLQNQAQQTAAKDEADKEQEQPKSEDVAANSESADLLIAAKAYVSADSSVKNLDEYSFNISDETSDFGRVTVNVPEGGGYYLLFKRSIKQWVMIVSGQDSPPQETIDKYGIPAEFR